MTSPSSRSMDAPEPARRGPVAGLWMFGGAAAVAAALTVIFLSMRAVMEIGGTCAEGGPFVIENPCPKGVSMLILLGIWGGLILVAIYGWQAVTRGIPSLLGFAWPALFLSLGWNFFEYAFDPRADGVVWGWLVCGVLFAVMGGLPLLYVVPFTFRRLSGREEPEPSRPRTRPRDALRPAAPVFRPPARQPRSPAGMVRVLERLDRLHRSGAIDDQEYRTAKGRVLEDGE